MREPITHRNLDLDCNLDLVNPLRKSHQRTYRLINQTSATWQPRPFPPKPGSRIQRRLSTPSAVAAGGISNSSVVISSGFTIQS